MFKKPTPRSFNNMLKRRSTDTTGKNSGIFSNSGAGQKMDKRPKTSPRGPGMSAQSKGDLGALRSAVNVPKKKSGSGNNGKITSGAALRSYADHGEK